MNNRKLKIVSTIIITILIAFTFATNLSVAVSSETVNKFNNILSRRDTLKVQFDSVIKNNVQTYSEIKTILSNLNTLLSDWLKFNREQQQVINESEYDRDLLQFVDKSKLEYNSFNNYEKTQREKLTSEINSITTEHNWADKKIKELDKGIGSLAVKNEAKISLEAYKAKKSVSGIMAMEDEYERLITKLENIINRIDDNGNIKGTTGDKGNSGDKGGSGSSSSGKSDSSKSGSLPDKSVVINNDGILQMSGEGTAILQVIIKQTISGKIDFDKLSEYVWIYCVEHGAPIPANVSPSKPLKDATVVSGFINELAQEVNPGDELGRFKSASRGSNPFEATQSRTIAVYQASKTRQLVPEEAYVLAHSYREGQTQHPTNVTGEARTILQAMNSGEHPTSIQVALWDLGLKQFIQEYSQRYGVDLGIYSNSNEPTDSERTEDSIILRDEAKKLEETRQAIDEFLQANDNKYIVDQTDKDNCTVAYSRTDSQFLVGPFKIDYVRSFQIAEKNSVVSLLEGNSINSAGTTPPYTINFSGITEMVLVTDTGEINLTRDNFIYTTDRLIQEGDERYDYPYPKEEFYIKFPNEGDPSAIEKLKIKLQDINAEGQGYELTGTYKEVNWAPKSQDFYKYCSGCLPGGGCPGNHYDYTEYWIEAVTVTANHHAQNLMVMTEARIYKVIHEGEGVDIEIPLKLTMDLGGVVWEDKHSGKASDYNGIRDEGEKGIKGVKVTVYNDGQKVDEMYTDENGEYKFTDLKVGKYDVEFEYDGQTYFTTRFLVTSASASDVGAYKNDPNNAEYTNNSKARETTEARTDFNNKFYEIADGTAVGKDGTKYDLSGYYKTENRVTELITRDPSTNVAHELFRIQARTSSDDIYYPLHDNFHIADYDKTINNTVYRGIYPYMYNVNLGLVERAQADAAIKKDVYGATVTINDKKLEYRYNERANVDSFDIDVKASPEYSNIYYNREVYKSDYNFRIDDYKNNSLNVSGSDIYGIRSVEQELKVFVTYKVTLANQSEIHKVSINEIVDYFDSTYNLVKEDYYLDIQDDNGVSQRTRVARGSYYERKNGETGNIQWKDNGKYGTKTNEGYGTIYTESLSDVLLESGERIEIYVTFEVGKDANRGILLGEKKNVTEITSYSTFDQNATSKTNAEGRVDRDSAPNNAKTGDISTYEDDTDNAPIINVKLHDDSERYLDGFIWEDERTQNLSSGQRVGNGIREDIETLVNGVTVQLIELITTPDGQKLEYIWREMQTR